MKQQIETNVYPVKTLEQLNCKYRVYRVLGLPRGSPDYHKNAQKLVDQLSRTTRSPCIKFTKDDDIYIAQPEGFEELPETFDVVRTNVKIEKEPKLRKLRFDSLDSNETEFAERFLQFAIQEQLSDFHSLWQPQAGYPFYHKNPDPDSRELSDAVDVYRGFSFRIVPLADGGMGVCIDVKNKYLSRDPLPTDIDADEFHQYKGKNCIYEYGNDWYEIKIQSFNDLNASEVTLPEGQTLYEAVHSKMTEPKSSNLRSLPKDCSVLIYYNFEGDPKNVPSGLCREILPTNHPEVENIHDVSIKNPDERQERIEVVFDSYFQDLEFNSTPIEWSEKPVTKNDDNFYAPDLEFGNNTVLSTRGTNGAVKSNFHDFPEKKKELMYSNKAGMYETKQFDRQFFILPESIYNSFGQRFVEDLKQEVHKYIPREITYSPTIIPYDDSVQKSIPNLGTKILEAVEKFDARDGYAVTMIPRIATGWAEEDKLANLVMSELQDYGIYSSIIHTEVPEDSYEYDDGILEITSDHRQRGVFFGYLRNVALNKVLLLNSFWPFVLKTPLNADLTIGVDVKNNTVGFSLVYKTGEEFRFEASDSHQKEKLGENHIRKKLTELLREDLGFFSSEIIQDILIQRQGRLFPSEKKGVIAALDELTMNGQIPKDYNCNFVELRTTTKIPLRLFQTKTRTDSQSKQIQNPKVGTYLSDKLHGEKGFICNTGYPYDIPGTAKPLYVVKKAGTMPMEDILQDVFYLSNLTWTKVDSCSRLPMTIKMIDIRLRRMAGEYDEDELRFNEVEPLQ